MFIGLQNSQDYYKRPGRVVGVYGKGDLFVSFLRGSIWADGMGCVRRWVRMALRGKGAVSGHPGVS